MTPAFLFASLLWHEVLASWNAAQQRGERPTPALFEAMDRVLEQQAERLAIPRRFEATIKEIWALQPRFEQRAGQRPFRLLEHPRFRAAYDFLVLRCESGELQASSRVSPTGGRSSGCRYRGRDRMLKPDGAPKSVAVRAAGGRKRGLRRTKPQRARRSRGRRSAE